MFCKPYCDTSAATNNTHLSHVLAQIYTKFCPNSTRLMPWFSLTQFPPVKWLCKDTNHYDNKTTTTWNCLVEEYTNHFQSTNTVWCWLVWHNMIKSMEENVHLSYDHSSKTLLNTMWKSSFRPYINLQWVSLCCKDKVESWKRMTNYHWNNMDIKKASWTSTTL